MIWLAGSVLYGTCWLICARLLAGHFAWHMGGRGTNEYNYDTHKYERIPTVPDGYAWFPAALAGLALGLVWPLVLLTVKLPMSKIAIGQEAAAIRRRQAERIAELEREAGIR